MVSVNGRRVWSANSPCLDGSMAQRAWSPHMQANAKANAALHKVRDANRAALDEWEPMADPGPAHYQISSCFDVGQLRGPPGFGRSDVRQRPEPRIKQHPLGRTLGPSTYETTGFGSFPRYEAGRQQPWRTDRPTSRAVKALPVDAFDGSRYATERPVTTRARDVQHDPPHHASPGPGEYDMERYSQFLVMNSYNNYARSTRRATSSFGTGSRSDITMTHGDQSCRIQCPQVKTPATNRYSTVTHEDRLRLSSAGAQLGVGALEPLSRGKSPFIHSAQSLRLTLSEMAAHSPGGTRSISGPRPDLTARFKGSPRRPHTSA